MSSTCKDEETQLREALVKLESQISLQKEIVQKLLEAKQKKISDEKNKFEHLKILVDNQKKEEKLGINKENKVSKPLHSNKNAKLETKSDDIHVPDTPFTRRALANRAKYYNHNRYVFAGYKFVLHNNKLRLLSTKHELTNQPLLNADAMPAFLTFKGNTYIKTPSGDYILEKHGKKYVTYNRISPACKILTPETNSMSHHSDSQPPKPFCTYYTSTGNCTRANCPFRHVPGRIALCPTLQSMRHKCLNKVCHYSHSPSQYNAPSCTFFQTGSCSNENCMFTHKLENPNAPICREFAYNGYCEDGIDCRLTHSKQCPDLKEYGRCLRGRMCMCVHNTEILEREGKAMEVRNKDNDNVIQIVYDKNSDSASDDDSNDDSDDDNVEFIVGPNGHELSSNENFIKL